MQLQTRTLIVTGFVALLLATAGCMDGGSGDGGSEAPADAPDASTLQSEATQAMEDIETAQMTMTMSVSNGSSNEEIMTSEGVMDMTNRKMRMTSTSALMQGEMQQYVIDNTMYMQMQGEWIRQDVGEQFSWNGSNQFAAQEELLEGADIQVTGEDEVNGQAVWVVSVEPDADAVSELTNQQMGDGPGMSENVDLSNVEITQYIDKESKHILRTISEVDSSVQGQESTTTMDMTFSAFNEPVEVELPSGAENATDMGEMMPGNMSATTGQQITGETAG